MNKKVIYGASTLILVSGISALLYFKYKCKLSEKNEAKINLLHPKLRRKAKSFICDAMRNNINIIVTDSLRSRGKQLQYYNKGLSKIKIGYHNFGLAFDVVDNIKGYNNTDWDLIGKLASKHGFEWGGNWKGFIDKPHLQYTFGYKISKLEDLYNSGKIDKNNYVII